MWGGLKAGVSAAKKKKLMKEARGDMVHFLAARLQDKAVEKPQGRF
jgi:hypothetical protein